MKTSPSSPGAQTFAQSCEGYRDFVKAAHQLRADMNNRPQIQPSLVRRAEDTMARAQRATNREALTGYYLQARRQAHQAEDAGQSIALSAALLRSYAAAGAQASRAVGAWLALTAPLDFLVGQSRLLCEEDGDNPGLVAAGGGSPFSLVRGVVACIGAPLGAAICGAVEAASAMAKGADRKQWAKSMRQGAALGTILGGVTANRVTVAGLKWGQLGAQALVLALKVGVAIMGAAVGVVIGMPFGAVRVVAMALAQAKHRSAVPTRPEAASWARSAATSVASYHTACSVWSDDGDDDTQPYEPPELYTMATEG